MHGGHHVHGWRFGKMPSTMGCWPEGVGWLSLPKKGRGSSNTIERLAKNMTQTASRGLWGNRPIHGERHAARRHPCE